MSYRPNKRQKAAWSFGNGVAVVIAAAGSGKTYVIRRRYEKLLGKGYRPSSVLLLSHSRKAAHALAAVSGAHAGVRNAFTVHALCHLILREFYREAKLKADFQVMDEDRAHSLLSAAIAGMTIGHNRNSVGIKTLQSYITLRRSGLMSHSGALKLLGLRDPGQSFLKSVSANYKRAKATQALLDFDDLLSLTFRLLDTRSVVQEALKRRYRHIMVDEAQDLSPAQLRVIEKIFGKWRVGQKRSLFLVGDPGQSIYSFHGARFEFLVDKIEDDGVHPFPLPTNFRSTRRIVAFSDAIDATDCQCRLPTRAAKGALEGKPPQLTRIRCRDHLAERRLEADAICKLIKENKRAGVGYGEQAILLRTFDHHHIVAAALNAAKIPYKSVGGGLDKKGHPLSDAVRDIFRAATNPGDLGLLKKVISIGSNQLGRRKRTIQAVQRASATLPAQEKKAVGALLRCLEYAGDTSRSVSARVKCVFETLRSLSKWEKREECEKARPAMAHLTEIARESRDISEFLSLCAIDPLPSGEGEGSEGVTISTIHSAKGLEWEVVYLPQLQDGLLPYRKSTLMDEERRLLYVAITRARKQLYLSSTVGPLLFGSPIEQTCRFLVEPAVAAHYTTTP